MLDITIDGIKYEYVKSFVIDGKNYVAYSDFKNTYVSEYTLDGNNVILSDVPPQIFNQIMEELL